MDGIRNPFCQMYVPLDSVKQEGEVMSESMILRFVEMASLRYLGAALNRWFEKFSTPRTLKTRTGGDRRVSRERRQNPVGMRLRRSLLEAMIFRAGHNQGDRLRMNEYQREKLRDALVHAARKFQFFERNAQTPIPPESAIDFATRQVWAKHEDDALAEESAASVVERTNAYLTGQFDVRWLERRSSAPRRGGK